MNETTKDQLERNKRLIGQYRQNAYSDRDALSIKGKVVDDADIGDGKALVYNGIGDKIVYSRVGRGGGGGAWAELQDHGLEKCASYIIRVNGVYYEAINGSTGQISFGGAGNIGGAIGTDASAVINAAITALAGVGSGTGGIIHIKKGTYAITSGINLTGWLTLEGDGADCTVLKTTAGSNCNTLQFTGVKAANEFFLLIRNLHLWGASGDASGVGICLDSTVFGQADWCVENCFIERFKTDCIFYNDKNTWASRILNNVIEHGVRSGIYVTGAGEDTRILGNKFLYNAAGIYFESNRTMINSNFFYKNTLDAIEIHGSGGNVVNGNTFDETSWGNHGGYSELLVYSGRSNIITGNAFYGGVDTKYGIRLRPWHIDTNIVGNSFRAAGYTAQPIYDEAVTAQTSIIGNQGYNPRGNIATPYSVAAGYLLDVASVQAFPTTATNYTVGGSPKLITIYGGTVTSISIDGVVTGLTSGAFFLNPGQILNVVWTGQPSSTVYAC